MPVNAELIQLNKEHGILAAIQSGLTGITQEHPMMNSSRKPMHCTKERV